MRKFRLNSAPYKKTYKPPQHTQTAKKDFRTEFKKGDYVSVIRYEHGYIDGAVEGEITNIGADFCHVLIKVGYSGYSSMVGSYMTIDRCGDIRHTSKPNR